ncbi:hypothetical protein [Polymorphospora rubra]|uniref:hypothetical protein n=1 Tax=Polymorphospora rubra TaxID=338584 RepID=UPI00340561C0
MPRSRLTSPAGLLSIVLGLALIVVGFFLSGTPQIVTIAGGIGILVGLGVQAVTSRKREPIG